MTQPPIVPTPALHKALTKGLTVATGLAPHVDYFGELAKVCPDLQGSVDELSVMHAALDRLCRVGLSGQVTDLGDTTRG